MFFGFRIKWIFFGIRIKEILKLGLCFLFIELFVLFIEGWRIRIFLGFSGNRLGD